MVENKKLTSDYVKNFTKSFIDNEEDSFLTREKTDILNLIKNELINENWKEEEISEKEKVIKNIINQKKLDYLKNFTKSFIDNEEDSFLTREKTDILNLIKNELINENWKEEEISEKDSVFFRIINQKQFDFVIENISLLLNNLGSKINADDYDGVAIKKFAPSERNVNSNQTHIVIPTDVGGIFPYLYPEEYLKTYISNEPLKSYFTLEIPMIITESNLSYLKGEDNSHDDDKKFESSITVRRSKGDGRSQFEMGHKSISGDIFNDFNDLLSKDHLLIVLKIKEKVKYEFYGIKLADFNSVLEDLFNRFFYSNRKVTLIPFNDFDINENCKKRGGENILLYGVPGSGKSWTIKKEYCDDESRMERVVFHPDYTYSDFIGQIIPKLDGKKVFYDFSPGPFTSILKKAYDDPTKEYFLVIEEINRGNAPAIFGDVFQLLDRVTNEDEGLLVGTSEYSISNEYIADIVYGDKTRKVRIEPNLSIIATMNTSDQNVFTLDTAFQRRWDMRLIQNTFEEASKEFRTAKILDSEVTWEKFCTVINEFILKNNMFNNSSEDKRLGTYFVNLNDLKYDNEEDGEYLKNRKFPEKVLKYLWDDAFKLDRDPVFKTNEFNSLELIIKEFNSNNKGKRFNIFQPDVLKKLDIDYKTFESTSDKDG